MKLLPRNLLLAGLAFGLLGLNGHAQAEGSRSLYPSGTRGESAGCGTGTNQGCRANLDIQAGNFYVGKINRRTFLYVYAQAGEYILLGSRNRNNGGDVFVYNPQSFGTPGNETVPATANFTCSSTAPPAGSFGGTGKGFIADRAHELGGPNSADNSVPAPGGSGYVPCAYLAPSTGIYGVRFSVATSGGDPDGSIGTPVVSNNTVSAWDVTVRANATATTDINGRLFTYAWVAFTGNNSRPVFSTHYYVNNQGYRYSQQLAGLDPNGYVLYANSLGFLDNGQPLYKDIRGNDALIANVPLGVTTQIPQYPLFFNDVSDGGPNGAEVDRVLTALNIPLSPTSTTVSNVSFTGHQPDPAHTTTGAGGTFHFTTTNTTTYLIVISRDGVDFSPENTSNGSLSGIAPGGTHDVTWDGNDGTGQPMPASANAYTFRIVGRNGEIHFPILDVENNGNGTTRNNATFGGGPTVTRLNGANPGDTTVFFDDRGYVTSSGTLVGNLNGTLCPNATPPGPNPPVSLNGVDSTLVYGPSPRLYRWWIPGGNANTDCSTTAGWGDAKGLNLWTFFASAPQQNTLFIDSIPNDTGTTVSAPAVATAGIPVQGEFTFANFGAGTVSGVTYLLTIAFVSGDGCSPAVSFINLPAGVPPPACVSSGGKGLYTFTGMPTTLNPGQAVHGANPVAPMNFRYTAPATGPIVVTTTIGNTTGDVYPPNDTAVARTEIGTTDVQTSVSVPATANAGSTVSGSFLFANFSSAAASGVIYTATIGAPGSCPSGVTFVTLPTGVTLNSYDSSTCAATFNGLPTDLVSGQSFNFGFSYTAPGTGVIPVNTTINAAGDANPANNIANGLTTVIQAPTLGLAKTDGTTTVVAGGTTSYTLTVSNTGNIATSGTITLVDVLPGGMTIADGAVTLSGAQSGNWSCTAASNVITCTSSTAIAAGGASVFGYTVNVSAGATGTLTNKAEVGGGGDPLTSPPTSTSAGNCSAAATPTPGCAIDSDTAQAPRLGLAKTDGTTTVDAGGTTSYTLTVSNTGNIATSGTVTLVDVLPSGITIADGAVTLSGAQSGNWSCTAASNVITCTSSTTIAAGGTSLFGYTVNVSASATGTLTNKTEVGGGGDPLTSPPTSTSAGNCSAAATPTPGCAIDSDTTQAPKLGLAKTDGTTTVAAGGTTSYTLTVSNTGSNATSGTITLVDVLPGGMTITDGAVTLSGAQSGNWSCTAASNVITCTSSTAIAAGGTSVFGYTVNVSASATGTLTNKAEVGGGGDPLTSPPTSASAGNCSAAATPTSGCAIDSDTVNASVILANVVLAKSTTTTLVTPGAAIQYTLTATNTVASTTQAAGYTFKEVVPANTTFTSISGGMTTDCTAGAVAGTLCTVTVTNAIVAGTAQSASFTVTPVASLPAGTTGIVNQAYYVKAPTGCSLTGTPVCNPIPPSGCTGTNPTRCTPPPNCTASDPACVGTPVVPQADQADLSVTKSNGATVPTAGGTTIYTIRVTNGGPATVTGAVLRDPIAAGLTKIAVACSDTPGRCVVAPEVVQLEGLAGFALPTLVAGEFYEITVTARVDVSGGSVTNIATVTAPVGIVDSSADNASTSDTDTVSPAARELPAPIPVLNEWMLGLLGMLICWATILMRWRGVALHSKPGDAGSRANEIL